MRQLPPPPLGPPRPSRRPSIHRALFLAAPALLAGLLALGILLLARPTARDAPDAAKPTPLAGATAVATPRPAAAARATPTDPDAAGAPDDEELPEPEPAATPTAGPDELRRARVGNTDGQGANLRREPSAAGPRVKVLRDGTEVELAGPEREAEGRTWRRVQDETGATGWLPSEFLVEERAVGPRPTPTPVPLQIQVTDITSPVARGQVATLTIVTRPGVRCEVKVLLFGPASVPREGLEPKVADADGECSWSWTVPDAAVPGTWRYAIAVGTGEARVTREVTFGIT